jgi:hypothetical protein
LPQTYADGIVAVSTRNDPTANLFCTDSEWRISAA